MLLVASKVVSPERSGKILGCTRQNRPMGFSHSTGSSSLSFAQTQVSKSLPSFTVHSFASGIQAKNMVIGVTDVFDGHISGWPILRIARGFDFIGIGSVAILNRGGKSSVNH